MESFNNSNDNRDTSKDLHVLMLLIGYMTF